MAPSASPASFGPRPWDVRSAGSRTKRQRLPRYLADESVSWKPELGTIKKLGIWASNNSYLTLISVIYITILFNVIYCYLYNHQKLEIYNTISLYHQKCWYQWRYHRMSNLPSSKPTRFSHRKTNGGYVSWFGVPIVCDPNIIQPAPF